MGGTRSLRADGNLERVGRYRLARAIGSTPFGLEHLATYRTAGGLKAACTLLVVDRDLAGEPRKTLARLRPLLTLAHGGVLRALDAGAAVETVYVAYEHQVGRDLAAVLSASRAARRAIPLPVALHFAAELLATLGHALRHGRDEISRTHGQVRPEAVFLTSDGHIRLKHFGLANALGPEPEAEQEQGPSERDAAAAADLLLTVLAGKPSVASTRGGGAGSVMRRVGARLAQAMEPAQGPGKLSADSLLVAVQDMQLDVSLPVTADAVAALLADLFEDELRREDEELSKLLDADSVPSPPLPEAPTPTPPPMPGDAPWTPVPETVIARRYRIVRSVGEGGMGEVVEAEHLALGRRVAIKILHPALSADPEFAERFRREARAACRIGHQHIVDVTDFGHTPDGRLFYAMEYLEGRSLGALLDKVRVLEQRRAVKMILQVCDALDAAHEAGVVHRDLKPDNLVITREGDEGDFVRIVDFGIAQDDDPQSKRVTRTGQIVGTPPYMAPEQVRGTPTDARTDVYASGVILYEMVTGSSPFRAETAVEVMSAHLKEPPEPPRRRAPGREIHPMVEAAILRALEKEPDDRYQSMADMAFDLWAALEAIKEEGPRGSEPEAESVVVVPEEGLEGEGAPGPRDSVVPEVEVDGEVVTEDDLREALSGAATAPALPRVALTLEDEDDERRKWWDRLPWWAPTAAAVLLVAAVAVSSLPALLAPRERVIASSDHEPTSAPDPSLGAEEGDDLELLRRERRDRRRKGRRRPDHRPAAHAKRPVEEPAPAEPPVDADRARRFAEARRLMSERRYVYATHAYRVLVSRYPNDPAAHVGLGQSQVARGNYREAVQHFEQAVRLRPSSPGYRVLLAGALLETGERDRARRHCEEALRRDPDNEAAQRLLRRLR